MSDKKHYLQVIDNSLQRRQHVTPLVHHYNITNSIANWYFDAPRNRQEKKDWQDYLQLSGKICISSNYERSIVKAHIDLIIQTQQHHQQLMSNTPLSFVMKRTNMVDLLFDPCTSSSNEFLSPTPSASICNLFESRVYLSVIVLRTWDRFNYTA